MKALTSVGYPQLTSSTAPTRSRPGVPQRRFLFLFCPCSASSGISWPSLVTTAYLKPSSDRYPRGLSQPSSKESSRRSHPPISPDRRQITVRDRFASRFQRSLARCPAEPSPPSPPRSSTGVPAVQWICEMEQGWFDVEHGSKRAQFPTVHSMWSFPSACVCVCVFVRRETALFVASCSCLAFVQAAVCTKPSHSGRCHLALKLLRHHHHSYAVLYGGRWISLEGARRGYEPINKVNQREVCVFGRGLNGNYRRLVAQFV